MPQPVRPRQSDRRLGVVALAYQLTPGATEIQLLPAGEFRAVDGRPHDVPAWRIDAAIAAGVIAAAAARVNPLVVDYEHQTLLSEKNGQPAPAAGWFKQLEWREGSGLFATGVQWTPKAAAAIGDGEYRFISPVFEYDQTSGAVTELRMAALTNTPGLDGMAAVALSALFPTPTDDQEPALMNELLKALLVALGLPEGTTQETALTALTALKSKADRLTTEVAALKAAPPATPDPARFVPVEAVQQLHTQIAALTAQVAGGEGAQLVEQALADGRLMPALKPWAQELARTNVAALKTYLDGVKPVAALTGLQTGQQHAAGAGAGATTGTPQLSETELAVCKRMGLAAEQFLKTKEA